MANIKRGTNTTLPVKITGVDWDDVSKVEFVFKQEQSESAAAVKTAVYTPSGAISRDGDVIYIPWTNEETYAFKRSAGYYMDTRISLASSSDNPNTGAPIFLQFTATLFGAGEVLE